MRGYDTVDYAKSRLVETIIMKGKEPVMVLAVQGTDDKIVVVYNSLLGNKDDLKNCLLSECDLNPVQLGYVNHKISAHYIMRSPMRRDWRQGLRMLNLVTSDGENPRGVSWSSIANTIVGSFPTFKSAIERLNTSERKRIAFHRDFSMARDGVLEYKGLITVGTVNMTNGNVMIDDGTKWVAEAFDEAMENAV